MPPTLHARLGASGSHRWMNCPGSIRESEGKPDTAGVEAREGTAAHELVEWCLHAATGNPKWPGASEDPHTYIGRVIKVYNEQTEEDEDWLVTEEMADAVLMMVDYVMRSYRALAEKYGVPPVIMIERQFDLSVLNPPEPMFGTADVVLFVPSVKHMEVIDYKHGIGVVVEAKRNSQTMMYGLGAAVAQGEIPDTIRTTIVQPRAPHVSGPIRHYDFDREELIAFKGRLFEAAHATQDPDAPLNAGAWCRFCPAKVGCPAQRELMATLTQNAFAATSDPKVIPLPVVHEEAPVPAPPVPGDLDPEELAQILDKAVLVKQWLSEVESHAQQLLRKGVPIPGYKLVRGRSNRQWVDSERASRYLGSKGIKSADRYVKKLISPAKAEKALKAKGVPLDHLEKLWQKPDGKITIAAMNDPRPAVASVAAAFALPTPTDGESE